MGGYTSLPSRERGLKCPTVENSMETDVVAPFAGAWIEIYTVDIITGGCLCRSLRGSVD